jgi:membrane protein
MSIFSLPRQAILEMRKKDPLRMAGATAFFTTFALPPILIIIFQLFGLFVNKRAVGLEIMEILTNTLGVDGAAQIRQTTRGFRMLAKNWYMAVAGFLFLLFVATTLFSVIKNSFNEIWNIRAKEKPGFTFFIRLRARSAGLILLSGILLITGMLIDALELLAGKYIDNMVEGGGRFFQGALDEIVGVIIVTIWFIVLFRYIANGRPSGKACVVGGLVTGILFSAGKTLLAMLMRNSNVSEIYGTGGSIVLILLFVFYSSMILYFGAAFVKVYSTYIGKPIKPKKMAYRYLLQETE